MNWVMGNETSEKLEKYVNASQAVTTWRKPALGVVRNTCIKCVNCNFCYSAGLWMASICAFFKEKPVKAIELLKNLRQHNHSAANLQRIDDIIQILNEQEKKIIDIIKRDWVFFDIYHRSLLDKIMKKIKATPFVSIPTNDIYFAPRTTFPQSDHPLVVVKKYCVEPCYEVVRGAQRLFEALARGDKTIECEVQND